MSKSRRRAAAGVRVPVLVPLALLAALPAQDRRNLSLIAPAAGAARAGGPLADAIARASRAVVHVQVEVKGRNTFAIERPSSGVLVGKDGLVLTHWNLVREADGASDKQLFVKLAGTDGVRRPATIVAHDEATGLALLRAELAAGDPFEPIALAAGVAPGDPVAVLGCHDGEDLVAFGGVASGAAAGVEVTAGEARLAFAREDLVLTDASIQARCHGAALVDRHGELVGICSADGVAEEISEPTLEQLKRPSFGFVIPVGLARRVFGERLTAAASKAREPSAHARAVALAADAVVAVHAGKGELDAIGVSDPFGRRRRDGVGSGVVIDPSGIVLTNRHLVAGEDTLRVTLRSGESYPAKRLADHVETNSAVLRVELPKGKTLSAVRCVSADSVAVGDELLVVGNPEGNAAVVGMGVFSARRGSALQTDAPIGNHNGGGAVLTLDGELVALCDAGVRDRIDVAYAQRGDQAKVETSLDLVPTIDAVLAAHAAVLDRAGAAVIARRTTPAPRSAVAKVVESTAGAMLNVYVEITLAAAQQEDNPFATAEARTMVEGLGSGVIVDPSGLALTNWHVVDSATEPSGAMVADRVVRVRRFDGRVFEARVLSISREEDLALLQLELEPGESVAAVELGDSGSLAAGDGAIAIGNPLGRASTVTAGVVAAKNQSIRVKGRWAKLPHLLETDAAINPGNSGGALLDHQGRLIGINSAGASLHAVTGYAISVDHVREKLQSVLLSPEKLRSPYVGLTVVDDDGRLVVQSVDPFGPAAQAGIAAHDVLRTLAGEPVLWSVGWAMQVLRLAPDQPIAVGVERDGKLQDKTITPLSAAAWAVFRQTDCVMDELTIAEDAERVRAVAVAFLRKFTGDPGAEPATIPAGVVRVKRLHPRLVEAKVDLREGDLLLGIELAEQLASGEAGRIVRFEHVADVQRCIDAHSSYEGVEHRAWIARGNEVLVVNLPAKRLML
ncbi:MAG: trypsin-like peptidase domain-containing protein [Planctomycetes bacterium]|nr:trypsin-like peptidase domain-containing protein [Planctomycetota bacterium]